jgi:LacI family transcriptional regulator
MPQRIVPTMKQVAAEAGVTAATVSAVLRGERHRIFYSDETRARVQAIVDRLGYRVNASARRLREGRSRTVGVLIDDITLPFLAAIIRAAGVALHAHDYSIVLCNLEGEEAARENLLRLIRAKQVDSFLLAGALSTLADDDLRAIHDSGQRLVLIEREATFPGIAAVGVDNAAGGRLAAECLLARGGSRFAILAGPQGNPMARRRADGAVAALLDAGIRPSGIEVIETSGWTPDAGDAAMRTYLAGGARPHGVFAGNDLLAIGALRALRECGLAIPRDVGVVGFDDIPLAAFTDPPLTTVRQPAELMGQAAAELLVAQPRPPAPCQRVFAPGLVIRQST